MGGVDLVSYLRPGWTGSMQDRNLWEIVGQQHARHIVDLSSAFRAELDAIPGRRTLATLHRLYAGSDLKRRASLLKPTWPTAWSR